MIRTDIPQVPDTSFPLIAVVYFSNQLAVELYLSLSLSQLCSTSSLFRTKSGGTTMWAAASGRRSGRNSEPWKGCLRPLWGSTSDIWRTDYLRDLEVRYDVKLLVVECE